MNILEVKIVSNKKNKKSKEVSKKRVYKKPTESFWGRLLVWLLVIGMVGGVLTGVIVAIVQAIK